MGRPAVTRITPSASIDTDRYRFEELVEREGTPEARLGLYANHDRLERTAFWRSSMSLGDYWEQAVTNVYGFRPAWYGVGDQPDGARERARSLPGRISDRIRGTPYTVIGEIGDGDLVSLGYRRDADTERIDEAADALLDATDPAIPLETGDRLPGRERI